MLRRFFLIILFLISLCFSLKINSQDLIVKNGEEWFFYDKDYLDEDWYKLTNFKNWKKGMSPLGYGDSKNTTELYFGEDENKKHITKYFKKKIYIEKKHIAYEIKLLRDDGAIVYINGKEILRDNLPNATITNKTLALETVEKDEEQTYFQHFFDNSILTTGENIISVGIHQAYEDSSDIIFSMELIGHDDPNILSFVMENKNKKNEELENKLILLNAKFENEKLITKANDLENLNFNLKAIGVLLGIFLLISFIVIYFLFNQLKIKELHFLKEKEVLKENSTQKEKELVTLSTNLLHNKQYFKEIKAEVKGLKTDDKKGIKSIISQIDFILESDEDWNNLKQHFNAVHNNFYDRLIEKHPTLSETELRHCMFIKLHLQTKEIARILLIDPRSVQTARYRIKKKMNLKEDEDLREYLLQFP